MTTEYPPTRDYTGQREAAANGFGPDTGGDALVCADCCRPAYYDYGDDRYHHAFDCHIGCFLIPAEDRPDDMAHPVLARVGIPVFWCDGLGRWITVPAP